MFLFSSPSGIKRLFPDGQNVPSEMGMSGDTGCNIRLEPLFEGVEDKKMFLKGMSASLEEGTKKMETISDLHFQCSLRGSNPRPQH